MCLQSKGHVITNGNGGNYGKGNAPRTGKGYDPKQMQELKELISGGFTYQEIAETMGNMSVSAVKYYAKKWGIAHGREILTQQARARAEAMRSDLAGLSLREISAKHGITMQTAHNYRKILGLVKPPRQQQASKPVAEPVVVASTLDSQIAEMEAKLQALKAEKEATMARLTEARQAFLDSVSTLRCLGLRDAEMAEMMASMK
jgi:DNA-binding CsgD family transcriptional regulator